MRKILYLAILFLTAIFLIYTTAFAKPQVAIQKDSHVMFVIMGQSNSVGSTTWEVGKDIAYLPNIRVYTMGLEKKDEHWDSNLLPLQRIWGNEKGEKLFGFGNKFAVNMATRFPRMKIDIVPCGFPGQSINLYNKNSTHNMSFYGNNFKTGDKNIYQYCLRRIRDARNQQGGKLAGVLFHQGESDAGQPAWESKVVSLIKNMRSEPDFTDDLPFILGEISHKMPEAKAHNAMILRIAQTHSRIGLVKTGDLPVMPDNIHYTVEAQREMGVRYADAWVELSNLAMIK